MTARTYTGPLRAVVTLLDGVERTVARGDTVDVSDDQAALLDRTGLWAPADGVAAGRGDDEGADGDPDADNYEEDG